MSLSQNDWTLCPVLHTTGHKSARETLVLRRALQEPYRVQRAHGPSNPRDLHQPECLRATPGPSA